LMTAEYGVLTVPLGRLFVVMPTRDAMQGAANTDRMRGNRNSFMKPCCRVNDLRDRWGRFEAFSRTGRFANLWDLAQTWARVLYG